MLSFLSSTARAIPIEPYSPTYSATPAYSDTPVLNPATQYTCFRGRDFPSVSQWLSFEDLANVNLPTMSLGNTPQTVTGILSSIKTVCNQLNPPIDP